MNEIYIVTLINTADQKKVLFTEFDKLEHFISDLKNGTFHLEKTRICDNLEDLYDILDSHKISHPEDFKDFSNTSQAPAEEPTK